MIDIRIIEIFEGDWAPIYFCNIDNQAWYLLNLNDYRSANYVGEVRTVHLRIGEWCQITTLQTGFDTKCGYEKGRNGSRAELFETYWRCAAERNANIPPNAPVKALMLIPHNVSKNTYNHSVFIHSSIEPVTTLTFADFLTRTCCRHDYYIKFVKLSEDDLTDIEAADFKYLSTSPSDASRAYAAFRSLWYVATKEVMPL